jgi:hypothetical protein
MNHTSVNSGLFEGRNEWEGRGHKESMKGDEYDQSASYALMKIE